MVSSEADSETAGLAAEDKTAYLHPEKTEQDVYRKRWEECFHSDFSKTALQLKPSEIYTETRSAEKKKGKSSSYKHQFHGRARMDCGNLAAKVSVDGLSDTTRGISHQSGRTLWITNLMRP